MLYLALPTPRYRLQTTAIVYILTQYNSMCVRGRQAFSDGCVGDWGGGDYRDLMSGLDHALAGEQLLIVSESDSTHAGIALKSQSPIVHSAATLRLKPGSMLLV